MASTTNKRKANEISYAHAEQNGIGINNGGSQTPPIVSASSSHHGTPGTLNTHASEGQIQTTRHPITTNYIMPPTTTLASVSHPYPSYHHHSQHPHHLVQQQHHLPTPVASNTSSASASASAASNSNTTTTTNVPVDGSISGGAVMPTMYDVPHYYPPGAAAYPYPAPFPGMPMVPPPSYPYAYGPGHGHGHGHGHAGHGSHDALPRPFAPAEDATLSSPFLLMEKYDAILSSIDFEICNILTQEVNIVERATVAAGKSTSTTSNDITNRNNVQDSNRGSTNIENKEEEQHSSTSNNNTNTTAMAKNAEVVEGGNVKVKEEQKEKENTHPNTNSSGSSTSTTTSKRDTTATANTRTPDDANDPISMIAPSWDQLMVRLLYDTNRRKKELQMRKDRVLRSIQDQLALDHAASRKMTANGTAGAGAGAASHYYHAGAATNTSDVIGAGDGSVSVGSTTSCARSVGPAGHSHGSTNKKIRRVCHGEGRRSPYKHDHNHNNIDPSSRVSHSSRGSQTAHRSSSSRVRTRDNSKGRGPEEGHANRHRHRSEPRRHGHGYSNHHGGAGAEPLGSRTITNESRGAVAGRHV